MFEDESVELAYERHNHMLIAYAIKWFGRDEAEDAVSRTWLKAIGIWGNWRGEAPRSMWLRGILRFELMRWIQRKARWEFEKMPELHGPAHFDRDVENRDLIDKVLAQMRPHRRDDLLDHVHERRHVEKTAAWRAGKHARRVAETIVNA